MIFYTTGTIGPGKKRHDENPRWLMARGLHFWGSETHNHLEVRDLGSLFCYVWLG